MKIDKKYIILLGIFIVYLLIMFFFFGDDYIRKNIDSATMIISPDTIWTYKKGKWINEKELTNYSMKNYDVYEKGNLLGNYQVTFNEKLYIFDKDRNPIRYENDLIAIKGTIDIDVIPFEIEYISSNNPVLTKAMNDKKINASMDNVISYVIKKDIDNDGVIEEIYASSNVFEVYDDSDSFALIFIKDGEEITYIKEDVNEGKYTLSMCIPSVQNIIDIDKDKKYEIITACSYYSDGDTCHTLYDNNYKPIKSC